MDHEYIPYLIGPERILFQGRFFEIVEQTVQIGNQNTVYEFARRSPGVRLIIVSSDQKILLTEEHRMEHAGWDFRLPGGKVFDSLGHYKESLMRHDDILLQASAAAKKEALEEIGLEINEITHYCTDTCGATVIWDLFYFVVDQFTIQSNGQQLELGENIKLNWVNFSDAQRIALNGQMHESRSVAILLRFLRSA